MNKDLTVGKPQTVLWKFCMPLFGSIIFQQLYNIADSLVAGKFIGENALAAVGNSYEITLIFIAFAFGCNMGCSVVVSKLFGAKKYKEMKSVANMLFDYAVEKKIVTANISRSVHGISAKKFFEPNKKAPAEQVYVDNEIQLILEQAEKQYKKTNNS